MITPREMLSMAVEYKRNSETELSRICLKSFFYLLNSKEKEKDNLVELLK